MAKPACGVDNCEKPRYNAQNGYCRNHSYRFKKHGDPLAGLQYGQPYVDGGGYVRVWRPDHPSAHNGRVHQHRIVMEEILGRHLLPGENVHHINGDRADNRPENLELWVTTQPAGQRPEDLVAWAKEILERYDQ